MLAETVDANLREPSSENGLSFAKNQVRGVSSHDFEQSDDMTAAVVRHR
jgi:hypothetical protein